MTVYKGTAVSAGIATGSLYYIDTPVQAEDFEHLRVCDTDNEITRLINGCSKAVDQLMELYDKAVSSSFSSCWYS